MPTNRVFEGIYYTLAERRFWRTSFEHNRVDHLTVYINALLATLNARPHLREHMTNDPVSLALTTLLPSTTSSSGDMREAEGVSNDRQVVGIASNTMPSPADADKLRVYDASSTLP